MSLFTTLGDAFGLAGEAVTATLSPADQALLTQIPVWKAAAQRGDTIAYDNLQCVAGNGQYGSCPAAGYVQGQAQAALTEVQSATTLGFYTGQVTGGLAALGNAVAPNAFWSGLSADTGVSIQSVQLVGFAVVAVVADLLFRRA